MTERERLELEAERVGIDFFLEAVKEAQANKDHVSIHITERLENTSFNTDILSVDPDTIEYKIDKKILRVGGARNPYFLEIPSDSEIFCEESTPEWFDGFLFEYSLFADSLIITFVLAYDETFHPAT